MSDLEQLRRQIDDVDERLVHLLNERANVVVEIGKVKRQNKRAEPIYAPDREHMVLNKIKDHNEGPLPDKCLVAIYQELMSGSFFLERPLRIAFLGPEGSFSHLAAVQKFGKSVEYESLPDIHAVFDEIMHEHCDLGLVPVENTIGGGVIETLDAFIDSSVTICAEVLQVVHHNLLAKCSLEDITKVYSKPEVFAQCRNWLTSSLSNVEIIPSPSTARAAQWASKELTAAAIGSKLACELYDLQIIRENIEDMSNNVTRFFVIGGEPAKPTGDDKTSLLFSTSHKAGALVDVLQAFRYNNVNLTNIESRPSRQRQREYYFFVDCQGHHSDENVRLAISESKRYCLQMSVLGSYPRATDMR